ncbi:uncharacterized protein LOC128988146 [Macrosteles quadrilineatus]|uniref:uncharacterized protein LOC128988146 n=1 Tax=Macrosteles quadrilineatus TaxID=74068 RepID=UPI0023E23D2D|nr:uncharacterized protein LOC128988146 [Macrosteles quadrilineatus]
MFVVALAPLLLSAVVLADGSADDGIGPITVSATSNVLTVKLAAPPGKFNLVSFHMRLDHMITVPEQGTIASPNLLPPQDYRDGAFVWNGPVIGKTECDLKGKPIYYWVRVEENGLGKNGIPKTAIIN